MAWRGRLLILILIMTIVSLVITPIVITTGGSIHQR